MDKERICRSKVRVAVASNAKRCDACDSTQCSCKSQKKEGRTPVGLTLLSKTISPESFQLRESTPPRSQLMDYFTLSILDICMAERKLNVILIAAQNQSCTELTDPENAGIVLVSKNGEESNERFPKIAFLGYSTWRREENRDANLFDQQVFVVRDGQIRFLEPRNDAVNHSPDGLSWGYLGSGPAQLAAAILMELFGDWQRVAPLHQRFKEEFVAKLPLGTNWAADGTELVAMALAIEGDQDGIHHRTFKR